MVYRNKRKSNYNDLYRQKQFKKNIIFTWVEKTREATMFSTDCKIECVRQAEKNLRQALKSLERKDGELDLK